MNTYQKCTTSRILSTNAYKTLKSYILLILCTNIIQQTIQSTNSHTNNIVTAMIIGQRFERGSRGFRGVTHTSNINLNGFRISAKNSQRQIINTIKPLTNQDQPKSFSLASIISSYQDSPYPEKNNDINNKSEKNKHNEEVVQEEFSSKGNLDKNKLRLLRNLQSQQKTTSLTYSSSFDFDMGINIDSNVKIEKYASDEKNINSISYSSDDGLSLFHRRLLATTSSRQRFVFGTYPLYVSIRDSPTRKWLGNSNSQRSTATLFPPFDDGTGEGLWEQKQLLRQQLVTASSQVFVNDTIVERSLASFERYAWLKDSDDTEKDSKEYLSLELVVEIFIKKPAYLNILPKKIQMQPESLKSGDKKDEESKEKNGLTSWFLQLQRQKEETQLSEHARQSNDEMLWVTDFSLIKQGGVTSVDTYSGIMRPVGEIKGILSGIGRAINSRDSKISFGWPNEVGPVPTQTFSPDLTANNDIDGGTSPTQKMLHKPFKNLQNALLVTDGFLVPGRENGGVYIVKNLGRDNLEWKVCLTGGNGVTDNKNASSNPVQAEDSEWFYHRAVWVDLTGDGRKSILTARAKRPSILNMNNAETISTKSENNFKNDHATESTSSTLSEIGQLVWLECPKPHRYDTETGTPLDVDDTVFDPFSARHLPWKQRILDEGPDVMFSIADLDTSDDTIEVFASQFFGKCVSLHSIQIGNERNDYMPKVTFRRVLDNSCGPSFSSILAELEGGNEDNTDSLRCIVDCGSTIETLQPGDTFSHLLVTSHESSFTSSGGNEKESDEQSKANGLKKSKNGSENKSNSKSEQPSTQIQTSLPETLGGSLFSYSIPENWKIDTWERTVIATGFGVRGQLGNMINPGAPGFCYTFYPKKRRKHDKFSRPYIAVSGDCAEAAYIFQPSTPNGKNDNSVCCVQSDGCNVASQKDKESHLKGRESTLYSLMCEIECGATVGSLAIGYDNCCGAEGQRDDYAKIYIPCFEKDKVLVFSFGNGEEEVISFD